MRLWRRALLVIWESSSFERDLPCEGKSFGRTILPCRRAPSRSLSASGLLCRAPLTSQGDFACSPSSEARHPFYQARVGEATLRLTPRPGRPGTTLAVIPGPATEISVSRPGGRGPVEHLRAEIEVPPSGSKKQRGLYARSRGGVLSLHLTETRPVRLTLSNPAGGPKATATVNPTSKTTPKTAMTLPEGPVVFGSVSAAGSGDPLEGAEIEIGTRSDSDSEERADVSRINHSGPEGTWRFGEVPEARYRLLGSAPGYSSAAKTVSVPVETNHIPQALVLQQPGRVHGKVVGVSEGGIASAKLRADLGVIGQDQEVVPDRSGEFTIQPVGPGQYSLILSVKGQAPEGKPAMWMSRFSMWQ
ncbi:MAG: hypothetical protein DMH00_11165 [Acidobacteria bacterium]|nr:MAG: hypothetical protein DMH00_11165 [Acidobacteriota bacterium]